MPPVLARERSWRTLRERSISRTVVKSFERKICTTPQQTFGELLY